MGEPQLVWPLEGVPVAQIAAGSAHSMALSLSGTDGLVCTFGAGSHGLEEPDELTVLPHVIFNSANRWHTLVYISNLGEIYSFGSGAEGQLGKGEKCDRLIPLPLDLTVNGQNIIQGKSYKNISEEMVKVIAGENQSIVLLLKEKQKYANLNRMLAIVEEEKVAKWISNSNSDSWHNIQQEIKLIFSSAACINGSFWEKRERNCTTSWETANVDMPAVFRFCEMIVAKPKVFTEYHALQFTRILKVICKSNDKNVYKIMPAFVLLNLAEHIKLKKNSKVDLLDSEESHLLILSSEGKLSEHSLASGSVKSKPR
ncbi:hypothetical protein JD844_026399 [Phrynosoma platyrhinos]|uniref:Uncharacterized protein n=1 Tax=Phrynosoma platyrhinos TaxID=52577 RepID=A0ABQ7SET2_PHRPL|nr:hypothetical protein JD844_026399 [Phrynosoma platyrhinos]